MKNIDLYSIYQTITINVKIWANDKLPARDILLTKFNSAKKTQWEKQ